LPAPITAPTLISASPPTAVDSTEAPSCSPSYVDSFSASTSPPTCSPTMLSIPAAASLNPTVQPTLLPTPQPTIESIVTVTFAPTAAIPTSVDETIPSTPSPPSISVDASQSPTPEPSLRPISAHTRYPTASVTHANTRMITAAPTCTPTVAPTCTPTVATTVMSVSHIDTSSSSSSSSNKHAVYSTYNKRVAVGVSTSIALVLVVLITIGGVIYWRRRQQRRYQHLATESAGLPSLSPSDKQQQQQLPQRQHQQHNDLPVMITSTHTFTARNYRGLPSEEPGNSTSTNSRFVADDDGDDVTVMFTNSAGNSSKGNPLTMHATVINELHERSV
jgi:hypothetical protein